MSLRLALNNLFSLSMMRIVTALFSFALFGLLARVWGPEHLGEYSTIFTYFIFLMQFPLLGLHIIIARDVAADNNNVGRYIVSSSFLSFCISFLIGLLVIAIGLIGYKEELHSSFIVLALTCLPTAIIVSFESALIGQEKMAIIAKVNIVESIIRTILSSILVVVGAPLIALVIVLLLGRLVALWVYFTKVRQFVILNTKLFDSLLVRRMLKQAPLFFGILLFSASIGKLDLIFLSLWGDGMHEVGIYSAAFKIYEVGIMVPSMISVVLFPIFSRLYVQNRTDFRVQFSAIARIVSGIGLPLTIMSGVLAPILLPIIFGDKYGESVLLFQLLCGAIFMTAFDQLLSIVLLAAKQEKLELRVLAATFLVYLASLFFLIPLFGSIGAAVATLIALIMKVCVRYCYASRIIDVSLASLKMPSLLTSGGLMWSVFYFISDITLAVLIGLIVYLITMFALKGVTKQDLYKLPHLYL